VANGFKPRYCVNALSSSNDAHIVRVQGFAMVRIRVVWYWKQYMRKSRYRYKRYLVYLPKAIGDLADTKADYIIRIFGPAIVMLPKGLENFFSRLEKLENMHRENTLSQGVASTGSLQEDSRILKEND
jgi:hypothetical protein